jgi:hypothetical protein
MKTKKTKAPARHAINNNHSKSLLEMDSDDILQTYRNGIAGGEIRETKKRLKMRVSGKSVFKIREIIIKKSRKA